MFVLGKKLLVVIGGVGLVLLVPLVAMQVTDGVFWTSADFILAGALLFSGGLIYVLVSTYTRTPRLLAAFLIAGVLIVAWAHLAVGVFDAPFAGS